MALKILDTFGYTVACANNGKEALNMLEDHRFDLVLMDVQMPEMDGFEATQRIRSDRNGRFNTSIPIIAMTAHSMKGDREKCIEAGMDQYVAKPIDPEELKAVIQKYQSI